MAILDFFLVSYANIPLKRAQFVLFIDIYISCLKTGSVRKVEVTKGRKIEKAKYKSRIFMKTQKAEFYFGLS